MTNELAEIPIKLAQLRQSEAMAIEGAGKFLAGRDMIAIALHRIMTEKLYIEERDENGISIFNTFESYWPHIKQKMGGISRSQAFNLMGDTRIALGPSFKLSYEDFVRLGGSAAFEAVKEIAEINQKTGEILGLRPGYEVPEGHTPATFIIEHMREYAPNGTDELSLDITEYKDVLKKRLKTVNITIDWFLQEDLRPEGMRYRTKWEKLTSSADENIMEQGYMDDLDVPEEIMNDYKKRLRVVGLYKFQE